MVERLAIKNFAIIDDMTIDFKTGFSVIVGETGTGKSIIIEAINLILGSRADNSMIKDGCEKSYLTGVFSLTPEVKDYLNECDIDYDDQLEIVRVLNSSGRSSYRVNGFSVQLSTISKIRDMIIEIKRQSDNEISNDEYYAVKLIDKFSNIDGLKAYQEYSKLYGEYQAVCSKLNELYQVGNTIDIDYVKMQIKRIEDIDVQEFELESLMEKSAIFANSFKISEICNALKTNLDTLYTVSNDINKDVSKLHDLNIGNEFNYDEINIMIEDFANSFSVNNEPVSESEIEHIESRIFEIKKLFDLYGDYAGVLRVFDELNEQLYQYENSALLITEHEALKLKIEQEMAMLCEQINDYRLQHGVLLCDEVKQLFTMLYMEDAAIKFELTAAPYSKYGNVEVQLLISTNNNSYWPIDKIASGGERARVILAIKKVLVDNKQVSTIIFDEVDTGVSGRVAKAMGKLMKIISKETQVIAITHLPQVAVCADLFLSVEKSKTDEQVVSNVKYVDGEEKIRAIAKLLSGDVITTEALENARSLMKDEG